MYSTSTTKGLTAEFSDDRRTVTFCARIAHSAPVYEWSLLIGDTIHNYRSALDALAWEVAHLDGRAPHARHLRRIYFPICTSRKDWEEQVKGPLSSVPKGILERLHSVQPYPFAPVDEGIFVILHKLDIEDKHKALLRADVIARDKHQVAFKAELENGDEFFDHAVDGGWRWIAGTDPVKDGDPIFQIMADVPIQEAESDMALPVSIAVPHAGRLHDVFELLRMIDQQVADTFEIVETGSVQKRHDLRPATLDYSAESASSL
ncbi:hypothetical protein [Agromyces sp. NPDC056965]|uniref:hypothetical protein n=1 Tax=Agromyces sp. NPDC056965 TaxID=3345983 RepID=UPI00363AAF48